MGILVISGQPSPSPQHHRLTTLPVTHFKLYIQGPSTFSMMGSKCLTQGIFTFDEALALMLLPDLVFIFI